MSGFSFPEAKNAKLGFAVPSQCEERRKKMWAGSVEAFKAFDEMPRLDLIVRADRVDWYWQGQGGVVLDEDEISYLLGLV